MKLRDFTTQELAVELLGRPDLINPDGVIPHAEVYRLAARILPIPCVDGIPLRGTGDRIEAMAIRRGTGRSRGLLVPVGGRINFRESIENALRRHFLTDVGCKIEILPHWSRPISTDQWAPVEFGVPPDFHPEGSKHAVQTLHLVRLLGEPTKFGSTVHGGQEVIGVEWFGLDDMPPPEAFGAEHHVSFETCLRAAETLLR